MSAVNLNEEVIREMLDDWHMEGGYTNEQFGILMYAIEQELEGQTVELIDDFVCDTEGFCEEFSHEE